MLLVFKSRCSSNSSGKRWANSKKCCLQISKPSNCSNNKHNWWLSM